MGLFKKKNPYTVTNKDGVYSLMCPKKGIEVHPDKVVIVDRKLPVLSKKLEFRYLESINIIQSSRKERGCLIFTEKFYTKPTKLSFDHSLNESINEIYKIAVQNFEAFKAEQERMEQERKAKLEQEQKQIQFIENYEERERIEQGHKTLLEEQEQKRIQNQKKNNPKEYERKAKLCETIYNEYKELLKQIKETDDIYEKIDILKECYRKLDVIDRIHHHNDCYRYMTEEMEQVEKKAKSVINAYIKEEKENGAYYIDIIQFADDLDFISNWIYEKDEKLNQL